MKEKRSLIRWIKAHKRELVIAGVSIAAVIGVVLLIRNQAALKAYWEALLRAIGKPGQSSVKAVEKVVKTTETARKTTETVGKAAQTAAKATHTAELIPFDVAKHVRNLPEGWHASPGKIATALENGIELLDGQTWVDSYWKGVVA